MDETKVPQLNRYQFSNYQLVTVQNPRKEDYHFKVEGRPYVIKAGTKKKFPGYIATVCIRQLTKLVAQDEKKIQFLVDPALKEKYYQRLIISVEELADPSADETPSYLKDDDKDTSADDEDEETDEEDSPFGGAGLGDNDEDDSDDEDEEKAEGSSADADDVPSGESFGFSYDREQYFTNGKMFSKDGVDIPRKEFEAARKKASDERAED